jgi:hypothetical protein
MQVTTSRKFESQAPEAQLLAQLAAASQTSVVSSPHGVVEVRPDSHAVLQSMQVPRPLSSKPCPARHCFHAMTSLRQANVGAAVEAGATVVGVVPPPSDDGEG